MKTSDWYLIHVCSNCEQRLTDGERRHSEGVCPNCGENSKSGTYCNTNRVILREIRHHQWWEFWNRKYTYEGSDKYSIKWLNGTN